MRTRPPENETVWFWIDDGKEHIHCMRYNRTGWHLGWWSGSRWHSYFDATVAAECLEPRMWMPLGLPEVQSTA